jgi:biotin transport system ATP-binding protein
VIVFDRVTVEVAAAEATKVLLDDLSCRMDSRRVALIGDNGSGKSTLLRAIVGLVRPSQGRIEVDGLDPARQVGQVRRRVGFVFTDPMAQLLMPTAVEDVELSLTRLEPDRSRRAARARQALLDWGLDELAERSVYDLSGGERQLVALISVLATEPAVILADEPTTLLDRRHRRRLEEVFDGLDQDLVVATHDLDWASRFERVVLIDQGRVAAEGGPRETIAHYRRLTDG